jgi:hypothetical protein
MNGKDEKPKPGLSLYSRGRCANGHMKDQRAHPNAKVGDQYLEPCSAPRCNSPMRFIVR